jgi:hypothetical protein
VLGEREGNKDYPRYCERPVLFSAVLDLMHIPMSFARNSGGPIRDLLSSMSRSGLMKPVRQRSNVYRNRESDKSIVAEKLANKMK